MKQFFYSFILTFAIFSGKLNAQSYQNEPFSQNNTNERLVVYPNPAKDFLYIKTTNPNVKIKSITFHTILGNVVAEIPINSNYSEIRVDKLKSGKYLMRYILNDNTQKVVQIIKQ